MGRQQRGGRGEAAAVPGRRREAVGRSGGGGGRGGGGRRAWWRRPRRAQATAEEEGGARAGGQHVGECCKGCGGVNEGTVTGGPRRRGCRGGGGGGSGCRARPAEDDSAHPAAAANRISFFSLQLGAGNKLLRHSSSTPCGFLRGSRAQKRLQTRGRSQVRSRAATHPHIPERQHTHTHTHPRKIPKIAFAQFELPRSPVSCNEPNGPDFHNSHRA